MPKQVRLTRPGANPARDAQRRIEEDIKALASTDSGVDALDGLRALLSKTHELDLDEGARLISLARSAFIGGNRNQVMFAISQALAPYEESPYRRGWRAHNEGLASTENPYPEGTADYVNWDAAWRTARAEKGGR